MKIDEIVASPIEVEQLKINMKNPAFVEELQRRHDRNHPTPEQMMSSDNIVVRVRERSKTDQVKSLVKGQELVAGKGSRRTKERKIGEVIYKV